MTDTTDKARELVEMSEKAQHPFAGSLPRLRLAEAKLEHAVDLARAYLEQAEQLEAARRERDEWRHVASELSVAVLSSEARADTAEALVARLAGALARVDAINDNPARYSSEINAVVMPLLSAPEVQALTKKETGNNG